MAEIFHPTTVLKVVSLPSKTLLVSNVLYLFKYLYNCSSIPMYPIAYHATAVVFILSKSRAKKLTGIAGPASMDFVLNSAFNRFLRASPPLSSPRPAFSSTHAIFSTLILSPSCLLVQDRDLIPWATVPVYDCSVGRIKRVMCISRSLTGNIGKVGGEVSVVCVSASCLPSLELSSDVSSGPRSSKDVSTSSPHAPRTQPPCMATATGSESSV